MIVAKEFTFDSAHFLKNYRGKCERMHGHTYKLQVFAEGPVQEDGMVMDFAKIKEIVHRKVLEKVDHNNLNDILPQSSVENLCIWVWDQLKEELPFLAKVKIWESPTSFAVYQGK